MERKGPNLKKSKTIILTQIGDINDSKAIQECNHCCIGGGK